MRHFHYQCASIRSKPFGVSFLFLVLLIFFSFFLLCLCLYLFYFAYCETQKKHLKCKRIGKLLSCFYFLAQADVRPGSEISPPYNGIQGKFQNNSSGTLISEETPYITKGKP